MKCKGASFMSFGLLNFKKFLGYENWKPMFRFQRIHKFFKFISYCYVKFIQEILEKVIDPKSKTFSMNELNDFG